jgi:alginate O-acetyltransferase complex protein AlgI
LDPYLHVAGTIALAIVYPLLPQIARRWLLLAASYLFYAAINVAFVPILFTVSLISYLGGFAVERWSWSRAPATLTIILLLLPLIFYKYWEAWFGTMILPGIPVSALQFGAQAAVLIPVGLSFYTFQAIGYVIDVKRKTVAADYNFVRFFLFKSFFPLLLAGPIERYKSLAPQLWEAPLPRIQAIGPALLLMFYGLFMKTVIGDRMGATVDEAYLASVPGLQHALVATIGFTIQIFADFAGYSLIAVGSAQLFGVDVTRNFKQPFFSHNLVEFWQRWHISLTRWIGDYLYRPLGRLFWRWTRGNQLASEWLTALIVWTVMGLWHGPTAQFVLFGVLQALAMQAIKLTGPDRPAMLPAWRLAVGMALTFAFVSLTFGLIRTPGIAEYGSMMWALISLAPGRAIIVQRDILYAAIAAMVAVEAVRRFRPDLDLTRSPAIVYPLIFFLFLTVILLGHDQSRDFVYFRF